MCSFSSFSLSCGAILSTQHLSKIQHILSVLNKERAQKVQPMDLILLTHSMWLVYGLRVYQRVRAALNGLMRTITLPAPSSAYMPTVMWIAWRHLFRGDISDHVMCGCARAFTPSGIGRSVVVTGMHAHTIRTPSQAQHILSHACVMRMSASEYNTYIYYIKEGSRHLVLCTVEQSMHPKFEIVKER